jgi:hypothetical protein
MPRLQRSRRYDLVIAGCFAAAISAWSHRNGGILSRGVETLTSSVQTDQRPILAYSPSSGLGNSMISLVSTRYLADVLNFRFVIDWGENESLSCRASYATLFQVGLNGTSGATQACETSCALELTQRGSQACWSTIKCADPRELLRSLGSCTCVRVKSNMFFLPILPQVKENTSKVVSIFTAYAKTYLQPSARIQAEVMNAIDSWKLHEAVHITVGVHVRSALHGAPMQNGRFIPKPGIFEKVFWPCLRNKLSKYPAESIGVFVAADTAEVREEAARVVTSAGMVFLPTPIESFPNDTGLSPTRSSEEVIEAAVELFLLTHTDFLFVKRSDRFDSTYSAAAASLAKSETKRIYVSEASCMLAEGPSVPDFHLSINQSCKDWQFQENSCSTVSDLTEG